MFRPLKLRADSCLLATLLALVTVSGLVIGDEPKSPDPRDVNKVIDQGLAFLTSQQDTRLGGNCLIGLCFLKNGQADHPSVARGIELCKQAPANLSAVDNYSLGISLVFLCEVDPRTHTVLIGDLVAELFRRQQAGGAWGYTGMTTGDTSQTQYAVWGLWMAQRKGGIAIPSERLERVCGWLMRTQDVGGGFVYQGHDPSTMERIQQQPGEITLSRSAAGLGSLYMLADLLQVPHPRAETQKQGGLRKVADGSKMPLTMTLRPADIQNALAAGDEWFRKNYAVPAATWQHYYLYALERYEAFRMQATGERDRTWYRDGFAWLKRTQKSDGGWDGQDNRVIATCFAVLFLSRSTAKAFPPQGGEGTLVSGPPGLPSDMRNAYEVNGELRTEVTVTPELIDDLLQGQDNSALDQLAEQGFTIPLSEVESSRRSQIAELRVLVRAGNYAARKIAVATLAKDHDLDNVPALLFALTDPDIRIVLEADNGLRFLSRKLDGVGLPERPTQREIEAARKAWKTWYLSLRPGVELLD